MASASVNFSFVAGELIRKRVRFELEKAAQVRGLPPSTILIRFMWGAEWHPEQSGKRPGHYKGEKGEK